uniref:Uncharacterized protein n=1 Tax=Acrobeloides nanus TaxID=290746 RepID=A0A914CPB1_9BILA
MIDFVVLEKTEVGNLKFDLHSIPAKKEVLLEEGFEVRTMLTALAFNENRLAEMRGDRRISEVYECFSKSKGEKVTKIKKGPIRDGWKKEIVEESLERKRRQGPREQVKLVQNEDLDVVVDQLEELLMFSDSKEEEFE